MIVKLVLQFISNKWTNIACRLILAAVFIYAAIGKILNPHEFTNTVAAFRILPISFTNIVAIILPWLEIACGLSMFNKSMARSSSLLMIALNIVFILAATSAMARGLDIECGCFTLSRAHSKVGWMLVARDIMLIVMCLPVLFGGSISEKKTSRSLSILSCRPSV